eukprot:COSAG01_NODE_2885_length_6901_cov_101.837028_7_plen_88_part_00
MSNRQGRELGSSAQSAKSCRMGATSTGSRPPDGRLFGRRCAAYGAQTACAGVYAVAILSIASCIWLRAHARGRATAIYTRMQTARPR